MLFRFRALMKSFIFKVLLFGLLISSFALFGLGDLLTDRVSQNSVLEVGDISVDAEEFQEQYTQRRQELLDNGLNASIIRQYGLPQQVLDSLLSRSLFHAESNDLHLKPTQQEMFEEIRKTEYFQGPDGHFSPTVMQRALRVTGLSLQDYYDLTSANLQITLLQDVIWQGHVAPSVSRDFGYLYSQEKRTVDYIKLDTNGLSLATQATDEVLQQYFDANKDKFQEPERRNVSYIYLSIDELKQQFTPPKQMIEEYYQSNIVNYQQQEQRAYDFIRFDDQVKAQQFHQSLKNKQDFSNNAKAENLDILTNALSTKASIPDEALADAIYQLTTDKPWSAPIEGSIGFYVAYLQELKQGSTQPLSEVQDAITETIKTDEAVNTYTSRLSIAEDLSIANADLSEIAESLVAPIQQSGLIDNVGNDSNGNNKLRDLPPDIRFIGEAFSLAKNNTSYVITIDQTGFYLMNVDAINLAYTPEFADIKTELQENWEKEQKTALAKDKITQWLESIAQGGKLADIASREGYQMTTDDNLQRNNDKFGVATTSAIFTAQQGDVIDVTEGEDFYLVHIATLDIPDTVEEGKAYDAFTGRYGQDYGAIVVESYQNALSTKHKTKINQSLVQQIVGLIEGDVDY